MANVLLLCHTPWNIWARSLASVNQHCSIDVSRPKPIYTSGGSVLLPSFFPGRSGTTQNFPNFNKSIEDFLECEGSTRAVSKCRIPQGAKGSVWQGEPCVPLKEGAHIDHSVDRRLLWFSVQIQHENNLCIVGDRRGWERREASLCCSNSIEWLFKRSPNRIE